MNTSKLYLKYRLKLSNTTRSMVMKHTVLFALICTFIFITGCQTSFTPRDYGNATGISIYLGYTRVAEKQDDDFKKAAEDLWMTIQSINTYDELAESVDKITKMFDVCINNSKLSKEEKVLCTMLKERITDKVGEVIANKLESNENATEFLLGVREGIASMVALGQ